MRKPTSRQTRLATRLVSAGAGLLFGVYNLYLAFTQHSPWSYAMSVYYFLLTLLRSGLLPFFFQGKEPPHWLEIAADSLLILLTVSLGYPATMLMLEEREFAFGLIPAIAVAAYTTYKIAMTAVSYAKESKKADGLALLFRSTNVVDCGLSLLALQNALICVNGGMDRTMLYVVSASTLAVAIFLLGFCLHRLVRDVKKGKEKDQAEA